MCFFIFIIFIYLFLPREVYKERKKKYTIEKSGKEALNRNHKAYNVRLPRLQLTPDGYTCTDMTINSKRAVNK